MKIPLLAPKNGIVQRGLVAEYRMDQRNLLKWSEDFNKSEWIKVNSSFSNGKLIDNSTNGTHDIYQVVPTIVGNIYTFSFDVKKSEITQCALEFPAGQFTYFNLINGTMIFTTGCLGTSIVLLPDGYYRCSITVSVSVTSATCYLYLAKPDKVVSYVGDGISSYYARNAQLELGSTPTDYQKTTDLQTLWNSKKSAVSVKNEVVNGNFASGVSGWTAQSSNIVNDNGQLRIIATAQYGSAHCAISPQIIGNKYYYRLKISGINGAHYYGLEGNEVNITSSAEHYASSIRTSIGGSANFYIGDNRSSGWTEVYVDNILCINLTATFGAGNEPTLQQCDDMFSTWFDGTQVMNLPCVPDTVVSATNLVLNGNFALDSNADGIADGFSLVSYTNPSILNNTQTWTPTAQYSQLILKSNLLVGHVYYGSCFINATSSTKSLIMYQGSGGSWAPVAHSSISGNEKLSVRTTMIGSAGSFYIQEGAVSGFTPASVKSACLIDLTATFGAGNEPSLAQCDQIFANWFDGTATVTRKNGTGLGQLGATTGVDTSDPTPTGQGYDFKVDDYVKLPLSIDANQDFTVYLVANVGAVAPSAEEYYAGVTNSANSAPRFGVSRLPNGNLQSFIRNDASSITLVSIPSMSGVRLLILKKKSSEFYIKDIIANTISGIGIPPVSPITLNQITLGTTLVGSTPSLFSNQPEYWASFYQRATTDAEDKQNYRAIKRELAKLGVTLGSKNEFFADFVGKVAGSTVVNANVSMSNWGSVVTGFKTPSQFTVEAGQTSYNSLMSLDGTLASSVTTANLTIAQQLFSFNIIRDIEKDGAVIPGTTLAEKIQWCKDNVNPTGGIKCNLWGYGTSPVASVLTYKATLASWSVSGSTWLTEQVNTANSISRITATPYNVADTIDANGFIHFLAYADPSNGTIASTIYTDTCNLLITLKSGVVL